VGGSTSAMLCSRKTSAWRRPPMESSPSTSDRCSSADSTKTKLQLHGARLD
jgi:hypothetical protein